MTFAAIALVFVTVRFVRGEKLETSRAEADETMQVLMQCAVLLPIAGCVPVLWGL